jgi:K+-dependent Na+/Ca+ exchanger-like protein
MDDAIRVSNSSASSSLMDDAMLGIANLGQSIYTASAEPRQLAGFGDIFTQEQLESGACIIYILVTLWMFLALAIVCDEFFVPALEVISDKLHLSNDIAGATFMAAGGSAPEFFTSLIGNFLGDSSVGIGTIVGSAVFNVLLVIGACAFVAPEPLKLTWFPLFRDSGFYAVDLFVLSLCFWDAKIEFWEALVLFFLYGCYAGFMIVSSRIEERLTGVKKEDRLTQTLHVDEAIGKIEVDLAENTREPPLDLTKDKPTDFKANNQINNEPVGPEDSTPAEDTDAVIVTQPSALPDEDNEDGGTSQDATASQMAKKKKKKKSVKGEGQKKKKTSSSFSGDGENSPTSQELQGEAVQGAAPPLEDATQDSSNDREGRDTSTRCLQKEAVHGAPGESLTGTDKPSASKDSTGTGGSKRSSLSKGSHPDKVALKRISRLPEGISQEEDEEEEEGGPLDLSFPSDASTLDKVYWVFAIPLMVAMRFTIPDVRREGMEQFYVASFALSITWIAVFTYFMVEGIQVMSRVADVPVTILALTIVAAGTSVPDMLTSIIVARKGRGDMAVSSSIGSNIFDVTVGMPVPWMVYMAFKGKTSLDVGANGLLFSISLLLGMLLATITAIMACKWVMDRRLGFAMVIMYIIFLIVALIKMV